MTDAFGGRGGIAQFNRDLLTSLSNDPAYTRVVALPRILFDKSPRVPAKLDFRTKSAGSKARYVIESVRTVINGRFDVVICAHINLLSIAAVAAAAQRVPLLLVIYGMEAWKAPKGLAARLAKRVDAVVAISDCTRKRFLSWSGVQASRLHVIPCCVDAKRFCKGPKRDDLLRRYRLRGRTVILTVARLAGGERGKGIDEVLESLTTIAHEIPNISYLVVGEGPDRERLERKAESLGVANRVVFTGFVPEREKADHYRLADAFVMPGRREGFGIVYLEALACGLPVVASSLDGSAEVVLNHHFGRVVDPDCPVALQTAVVDLLVASERVGPRELSAFSVGSFRARWNWLLAEMNVGNLATHPKLTREPAFQDARGFGRAYGQEKPASTASRVVVDR
ncbi:MAG: glycosyltransferase family 4 protein [Gemmatimonadaceae bacterium]|nr:glycosyltransferase family 4 protein [Gemmatimonadaceae bacterium]